MLARPGLITAAAVLALAFGAARAQEVAVETTTLGTSTITLYLHPFLTEEELATLRTVATNAQALALFVPGKSGFAALAVAPEDGFIRNGTPVPSATAVGDLADAATASAMAIKACDGAKTGSAGCVAVLEIAPAS